MSCRSGSAARKSLGERGTTVCCKSRTAILLEPVTSGCSTFASRISLLTNGYNVGTRRDTSACLASDTHSFCRSSSNRDPLRLEKSQGNRTNTTTEELCTRDNFCDRTVSRGGACESLLSSRMR